MSQAMIDGPGPLPTCRGVEHISMTVADIDEATGFFTGVFGCQTLYTMGPFTGSKGSFMRRIANADVRAVVHHVRVLRSPFLNIELFDATSPKQRTAWPDLLDIGGWHLAGYVDDMDEALDYLDGTDVYVLGEGAGACHCMTPWGFHFELRINPDGRVSMASAERRPWNPAQPDRGAAATIRRPAGGLPGFRGFERVSMTVPDLDDASAFFERVLGCEVLYDVGPTADRHGRAVGAYANVDVRAAPTRARLLRSPYLNIEVVECPPYPGQDRTWPGMLDVGGWHLAFYVDDVDAAVDHLATLDLHVLGGKKPAYQFEAGDDAYTVHGVTPFGPYFELVTYPHGRYRQDEHAGPAWHPGQPGS
jgi:catechol 2,3-dioxygenase-like lactoylglutathione lyase family enzyme